MWKKLGILVPFFSMATLTVSCSSKDWTKKEIFIDSVHDGDTFNSGNLRIRLFGVDTPEIGRYIQGSEKNYKETTGLQRLYGEKATEFARNLINHKNVIAIKETHDVYHRLVAKIEINGVDLAKELLRNGWAKVRYIDLNPRSPFYTEDYNYYASLLAVQHDAYVNNKGIWSDKHHLNEIYPSN